jgi:hypothetical protein
MRKLAFILGMLTLMLPGATYAQLNTHGGGTGLVNVAAGSIPFGSVFNIRMATSSNFQWSNTLNRLTFTNGSTTAFSAATICLTGDTCRTTWPTTSLSGGATNLLTYWTSPTTVGATSSPTVGFIVGTSTATSTFQGGINLTGTDCFAAQGVCLQTFIQNATAYKQAANYATAAVLAGTPTYSNGTAGVGATLTEVGTGALVVDGQNPSIGQRVLIKNQADQTQNGIYNVTATGSGIASYILTRSTDYNTSNDIYSGTTVPILVGGAANGDTQWTMSTTGTITVGTSNIVFIETSFGTSGTVTSVAAGSGINGGTITTSGTLSLTNFFATTTADTAGQVVYYSTTNGWPAKFASVATGTVSAGSSAITVTANRFVIGGALAIDCATAGTSQNGCLSSTDWNTFNGKSSFAFPFTTNAATAFFNAISNSTTTQIHLAGNPVSLSASSTSQFYTSTTTAATINTLYLPNQASALLLTGAAPGLVGTYGGSANPCTNQLPTTISALGAEGGCVSVTNAMLSNSNLSFTYTGNVSGSGSANLGGSISITVPWEYTPTTYNGTQVSASSTGIWNKAALPAFGFIASSTFFTYSSTTYASFTTASTTNSIATYSSTTIETILNQNNAALTVGSSTPWGMISINPNAVTGPLFVIGSSSQTDFGISNGGSIFTPAATTSTTTAIVIDWASTGPFVEKQIGSAAVTITFINATNTLYYGSVKTVMIDNPNQTAGAITWAGAEFGSTIPTQTTTANSGDMWCFRVVNGTSTTKTFKIAGGQCVTAFQ